MKNTKIEWVQGPDKKPGHTWNPVTGCKHGCEYCYARRMANRFYTSEFEGFENLANGELKVLYKPVRDKKGRVVPYPYCFEPTFHRYRLYEPQRIKKPSNIFVCSMADLFGNWVPDEWIREVFKATYEALQHRYLFLTKNPAGYRKGLGSLYLAQAGNHWRGISITSQKDLEFKAVEIANIPYNNLFLSLEPLHGEIDLKRIETSNGEAFYNILNGKASVPFTILQKNKISWVIIGAETGNRKGKVIPKLEWIEKIVEQCKAAGVPVFMKDSLKDIWQGELIREFPWEG